MIFQVQFVQTGSPSNRPVYMISNAELAKLPADSKEWMKLNMLNNHYMNRCV